MSERAGSQYEYSNDRRCCPGHRCHPAPPLVRPLTRLDGSGARVTVGHDLDLSGSTDSDDAADEQRYFVVDGRPWRRTDPDIATDELAALKSALGRARNAVRRARQGGDEVALADARRRVQLAKTGLGERGTPWWEQDRAERTDRVRRALDALDRLGG